MPLRTTTEQRPARGLTDNCGRTVPHVRACRLPGIATCLRFVVPYPDGQLPAFLPSRRWLTGSVSLPATALPRRAVCTPVLPPLFKQPLVCAIWTQTLYNRRPTRIPLLPWFHAGFLPYTDRDKPLPPPAVLRARFPFIC